ncbi:MAG: hypothetical protein KBD65_01600 [Candidatus Moranbacteria bacterium]|nr:hypothetical protein [Candidatus Moranbacteria bacterium]
MGFSGADIFSSEFLFVALFPSLLIAILVRGISMNWAVSYKEVLAIRKEFKGAQKGFRPKLLRAHSLWWRLLRGTLFLIGNFFLAVALFRGKVLLESFLIVLTLELVLILVASILIDSRYRRDLRVCQSMIRTLPKDHELPAVVKGGKNPPPVEVTSGAYEYESDRWE